MKSAKIAAVGLLIACGLPILLLSRSGSSDAGLTLTSTGLGTVETLLASYDQWEKQYLDNGGDRNMVLSMGWFKGLSTEESFATAIASVDLIEGRVKIEANSLPEKGPYEVSLVDNLSGDGRCAIPEEGDRIMQIGTLIYNGEAARFVADLGSRAFAEFEIDLVIISRAGKSPIESRVIVGTTTLFDRLYRSAQRGEFGYIDGFQPAYPEESPWFDRLVSLLLPSAEAQIGPIPNPSTPLEQLITAGRQIFFNETFQGNGRTCGTCHREDESLTIGPEFIATLPSNDPLFVAEFVPALASNFENPVLMRKFGLMLENVDGFDDLANKFVMRGVPHTLALLPNTLTPAPFDGSPIPPNERTGWSGDGAPGTGTLREFILGAITQHYPKTLNRVPGVDFRLATVAEMDALEAFMKSTGRRSDLVLSGPGALSLKSEVAARGQVLFTSTGAFGQPAPGLGRCNLCHFNGGASAGGVLNANFDTGIEDQPDKPADLAGQPNPNDGGFGRTPNAHGGFGDGKFNTPVLVEAADTGPYFHDNSVETIEGAVSFYNTTSFNNSVSGRSIGGIQLEATQIVAIAAFLRVINALENVRSSIDLQERALSAASFSQARELVRLSLAELEDAIEVLDCGGLHTDARLKMIQAASLDALALATADSTGRNALMNQSIRLKDAARNDMMN